MNGHVVSASTSMQMKKKNRCLRVMKIEQDQFIESMDRDGYVYIHEFIDRDSCLPLAVAIETELGNKIDHGSPYQEEPSTSFSKTTRMLMEEFQDKIIEKIGHLLHVQHTKHRIAVPREWEDTLYGRFKKKSFFTIHHSDALNTIFERRLFESFPSSDDDLEEDGNGMDIKASKKRKREEENDVVEQFYESKSLPKGCDPVIDVPIFTFWVCLKDICDRKQSHLRIHEASHRMEDICAKEKSGNQKITPLYKNSGGGSRVAKVEPMTYKYKPENFIGPEFPRGYRVGDIVIFHCLTQHEANPSRSDSIRISIDGRLFLRMQKGC